MDQRFDVIIVGSGAGGGTLARHLAPSGKSILVLERGDWLTREAANWDAAAVFVQNRYVSPETWYDARGRPFQPQVHYFVGGATKMFGAALYRLRQQDFGELKHYDGISPAWPIGYEDLEPYYAKAEEMYHVHGLRGHDPTEPPASGPYPCPPVSNEPRIAELFEQLTTAGYRPFPAPCAIMLTFRPVLPRVMTGISPALTFCGAASVWLMDSPANAPPTNNLLFISNLLPSCMCFTGRPSACILSQSLSRWNTVKPVQAGVRLLLESLRTMSLCRADRRAQGRLQQTRGSPLAGAVS
jgi:choline dehydrogenase-like flavoprotein